METMLVTGGAGFVGSNLALSFKAGHPSLRIVCLDNLKRRGSELNIPRLAGAGIEFLHGDIRNPEDLAAAGRFDLLLECSAEPSVLAGYGSSPMYVVNTNLVGTINCLEQVRRHQARVVFLSTSRVYPIAPLNRLCLRETATRFELDGPQPFSGVSTRGVDETFPLTGARSMYGATKLCSELIIAEYQAMYAVRSIVNRCGVLAGPWQMGRVDQGVAVLWAARHVFGGKLSYIGYGGTGKQVRDMLHVADLYRLLDVQLQDFDRHAGQVYNVGGGAGNSVSLAELTALCQAASGNRIEIPPAPEGREADIPWYVTDNAKVTDATGWQPSIAPGRIVEEITAWIREHRDQLKPILS